LNFRFKGVTDGQKDADMLSNGSGSELKEMRRLFIIDHLFALNQIDTIENCGTISNVIVPDTVLRYLNRKNIQSFHGLRAGLCTDRSACCDSLII